MEFSCCFQSKARMVDQRFIELFDPSLVLDQNKKSLTVPAPAQRIRKEVEAKEENGVKGGTGSDP